MLESHGVPTVVVGAVRHHMEKTQPPRAIFTPFQLGRSIGEPEDVAFQRRVLLHALGLLERSDGPVILEEFPDDPPGWQDAAGWHPPDLPQRVIPTEPDDWNTVFAAEMAVLQPIWDRAAERTGGTTVGLSGIPPSDWPALAARFLAGELPVLGGHETPALTLRFLSDDIKAWYGEAGQADPPTPSARQIDAWFWHRTVAGELLRMLREVAVASDNNALKTVGGRFLVPAPWLPRA